MTHYQQAKYLLNKYPPNSQIYIESGDTTGIVYGYKIGGYNDRVGLMVKVGSDTWFIEDPELPYPERKPHEHTK